MKRSETMKLGMPTLIELDSLEEQMGLCKALGLSFIEINMTFPQYQPSQWQIRDMAELSERFGISYTLHMSETFDPFSLSDSLRQASLEDFKKVVGFCKALNIPIVNMHLSQGVHVTLPDQKVYLFEKYDLLYTAYIEAFKALVDDAFKDTSTLLVIENTGLYDKPFILKALEALLQSPRIQLTWDVGHDHSSMGKDEAFMTRHEGQIAHMHLHDAIGESNHLTLFTGEIDLLAHLDFARRKACSCVIETKTVESLRRSIAALENYL